MKVWAPKDPDEVVTRYMDWTEHPSWSDGDNIVSATYSLPVDVGLTIDSSDHDDHILSKVTLSGGTEENRGKVLCEVTTESGQTLQQTMTILIRER